MQREEEVNIRLDKQLELKNEAQAGDGARMYLNSSSTVKAITIATVIEDSNNHTYIDYRIEDKGKNSTKYVNKHIGDKTHAAWITRFSYELMHIKATI